MHYDGANYYFIWDLNGTSIAHGAQPALEGKTFINSPDAEKNPVVSYMVSSSSRSRKVTKKKATPPIASKKAARARPYR